MSFSYPAFHNPAERIARALFGALQSLVHPVILGIVLLPMVVATLLWAGIAWVYWDGWVDAIRSLVLDHSYFFWPAGGDISTAATGIAMGVVIAILMPLVLLSALLIAAIFAMPLLVRHVARTHFPKLERRKGGTIAGSLWNAVAAILIFAGLWVATLPLWLMGPIGAMLPWLLTAWVNQRLFRYDALSEHADAREMEQIFAGAKGRLIVLGIATGVLYFIPPINLLAPVYAALTFIHFCLAELEILRAAGGPEDLRSAATSEK